MPKKFGTNSKSAEAREKVQAKKNLDKARKEKLEEDKLWVDDDKHINRKLERKNDKELKRQEDLERKRQNKLLAEEELNSISKSSKKPQASRLTQAEISAKLDEQMKRINASVPKKNEKIVEQDVLTSNLNRMGLQESSARTVDDAINILGGSNDPAEKHPEKRVKAAFAAYKQKMLPILKAENPTFKLSQLNERIYKDFQTSPENPKNQVSAAYNSK